MNSFWVFILNNARVSKMLLLGKFMLIYLQCRLLMPGSGFAYILQVQNIKNSKLQMTRIVQLQIYFYKLVTKAKNNSEKINTQFDDKTFVVFHLNYTTNCPLKLLITLVFFGQFIFLTTQ